MPFNIRDFLKLSPSPTKDGIEVETEPNVYEQYEEYVNPIPHGGGGIHPPSQFFKML